MKLISIILIIILPFIGGAQLLTQGGVPANLVQNVLLGPGVNISNITYTGSTGAIGQFTANGTNLGMSSGIVMTTGTITNNGAGPHGPNNQEDAGIDNSQPGYSLLSNLVGTQTFDASVLEFDFQTCSDSIRFNYIFGSEEYLEYVNTEFNDIFAFFISGPGIPGTQNIALLPSGQPVAINNVHSGGTNVNGASFGGLNAQYYVNNANGSTIQYDGFTKKLTATAKVQCDAVYHLRLAIADVGDGVWDSGIFLEAESLTAGSSLDLSSQISNNLFNDPSILAESCVSNTIFLNRPDCNLNIPLTVDVAVSGTAAEGVDFNSIPTSITFPAGSAQTQFSFDALQDGIVEGQETVILEYTFTDNCGIVSVQEQTFYINDINPLIIDISGGEITCPGEEIELTASVTGGVEPYTYLWSTGETTQSIMVSPTSTEIYSVGISDDCITDVVTQTYQVDVPVIPPLVVDVSDDIVEICPFIPAVIFGNATGGTPGYSLSWSSNFENNLSNSNNLSVVPGETTVYTLTATDICGNTASNSVSYTITSPPLTLEMSPITEICPGDSIQISVSPQGGFGQYFYQWYHSGETSSTIWVNPTTTTSYLVSVSDECQTFSVEGQTQINVVAPTADFTISSSTVFNDLPIQFENLSNNAVAYEWYFGDGQESTIIHPENTYDEPGTYIITLIAVDDKGCVDSINKPIRIEEEWYIYIPNAFTPDGNRLNSKFEASTVGINTLEVNIYNRWGEIVFTSNDKLFSWDGTYKGFYVPDGTYTYSINFVTNSGRQKDIVGHVNVLK